MPQGGNYLTTVYDVPSDVFIRKLNRYLMENVDEVTLPAWSSFVKTGTHRQCPPDAEDWWHTRCASLLRKIYVRGPVGISRLRLEYGGRKPGRARPKHFTRGGGNILRKVLQQLEKAGLVENLPRKGRFMTRKGRSLLDKLAGEIEAEIKG